MPTTGGDIAMYAVGALVALLAALTGLGMVANRVACGQWAAPSGVFDPLTFVGTGDATAFGETETGCTAPTWGVGVAWGLFLVVAIVGTLGGFAAYTKYRQSDKYFIARMRRREGLAKRAEIREWMGPKAAKKATGKVRPTLEKKDRTPEAGNILLGHSEGVPCWASLEESQVLLGPPRSGKGVNVLVGAIVDAPGPVITTSSRADNYSMTAPLRAKKGPVTLFDPQGLTGKATTLKWSPITGCEKPQVANQRASSLIGAAGLAADGNNSEWRAPAIDIMQALLHAAALENRSVDDLMLWGKSSAQARAAVEILREHEEKGTAAVGWGAALESVIEGDPKMRANMWFGVSNAVQGLSVDAVRQTLNPRSADETFDIDRFIKESGTLYIVGTKTGGSSAGPFLIAMMDAITERAREIAAKRKGNRLDPPLALILDEIANITRAWEGLVQLMADGGGVGISAMPVFQSLAQVRDAWGEQAASAIFDAATIKIQLGGASGTRDLEEIQKLAGQREIIRASKSRQKDGSSVSDQIHDKNVLEIDELRRLPFSWAIVLFRKQRPIFMNLKPYWKRKDADEIDQAKKAYAKSLLDPEHEHEWEAMLRPPEHAQPVHHQASSAGLEAAPAQGMGPRHSTGTPHRPVTSTTNGVQTVHSSHQVNPETGTVGTTETGREWFRRTRSDPHHFPAPQTATVEPTESTARPRTDQRRNRDRDRDVTVF
ncbi:type IV secretory system conjugative DNA transfer family protein [Nesterenkonia alkaliphila]|nr:TraM recognition domain-containing protein [Nesterenkonia alkaliphila]